jgi:hypothetical protein
MNLSSFSGTPASTISPPLSTAKATMLCESDESGTAGEPALNPIVMPAVVSAAIGGGDRSPMYERI